MLDLKESIITVGVVVLGTMVTRFLPFLIFPPNKTTPNYIKYLGEVLPFAVIGMLVIYCMKSVNIKSFPYGVPELISIVFICVLHFWKKDMLISIAGGTICYMVLIQRVFI